MSNSSKQRALITGATGFVGSHLTKQLVQEGWDVSIITRPSSNLNLLSSTIDDISIYRHDGSIPHMMNIMEKAKPDVVFHLASTVKTQHQPADVTSLIESNIEFGTMLVEAMLENNVYRLINTGTSWQHYQNKPYSPVCLYAATKQAYESILAYYTEASSLQVVNLMLFDTYGPNDPRPKLISLLLEAARTEKPLALSPGEQLIDIVHINDVVQAYIMAAHRMLNQKANQWEEFAVTSNSPIRLKDLVKTVEAVLGKQLLIEWGGRPYRSREVMIPWNNGKTLPSWQPVLSLEEGLRGLV
ncbi:NAD-dependent epimerase/dehydratase family protein [Ornithinibacillus californiensis]|uniref:NAD-dependent epimerase/dehydratase family protein n=1 Tax=Ornithinibacillus californiensis TaxID=161536 RepID=UPI00064D880F|nr:NAD-dependent epimerase/dehydratase family protein [Ornithinibacillus californiensis]